MKKVIVVVGLFCYGMPVFAQLKTDAQSVFKMLLFLDKKNISFRGMDSTASKNDSLYRAFSEAVYLKLDKLKPTKNSFEYELTGQGYNFYELRLYDQAKKKFSNNVVYKRTLSSNEGQFFGVVAGGSDSYIIAINQSTGVSYRLKGFRINDFLAFLADFKEDYSEQSGKKPNTKTFLNNYQIEDLDFECLYNGLTDSKMDRKKYPCLNRAADITR
jgi:hypothetical protein